MRLEQPLAFLSFIDCWWDDSISLQVFLHGLLLVTATCIKLNHHREYHFSNHNEEVQVSNTQESYSRLDQLELCLT